MDNPSFPFVDNGRENSLTIDQDARLDERCSISINGNGNTIVVRKGALLRGVAIQIAGDGCKLLLDEHCKIRGTIHLRQTGSSIEIGPTTSMVGCHLFAMEGAAIRIGKNGMFSSGIYVRTSDEHPIYDLDTNERINPAEDVVVGDNVWISEGVTLNKGAVVPSGCVIGARSFVSKRLPEGNAIYAGTPAKLIRSRIKWGRYL